MADEAKQQSSTTAHGRYEHLKTLRDPYLRRARSVAKVTIPSLVPDEGASGSTDFPQPFNSVGARGVNNLAAKLLLALFPPGSDFFKLTIDDFVLKKLVEEAGGEQEGQDARAEFDEALGSMVRAVIQRMEQVGARSKLYESLRQLIVAGNALVQVLDRGRMKIHFLPSYTIKRDGEGDVQEIIVLELISRATAPENIRVLIATHPELEPNDDNPEDDLELYTRVRRVKRMWRVHQEVGTSGIKVPESEGSYPLDKSAWIPLRFNAVDGEDYGRGYAEEYLGDLESLNDSYKSIIEYGSIASRVITLVDPGGLTNAEDIVEADNGAVLDGNAKDISVLALEKFHDFKVVWDTAQDIEARLEQAFLLMSGIQRHAERVTAEEIRRLASELEQSLGGIYSILAEELQRPLVNRLMHQMQRKNELPTLPDKAISTEVVTGMEALGRNQDLMKLDVLVEGLAQLGPEAVQDYLNIGAYITRRATALGISLEGLIRPEQEVIQLRKQRADQAMAEKAIGPGINFANNRAAEAQNQGVE